MPLITIAVHARTRTLSTERAQQRQQAAYVPQALEAHPRRSPGSLLSVFFAISASLSKANERGPPDFGALIRADARICPMFGFNSLGLQRRAQSRLASSWPPKAAMKSNMISKGSRSRPRSLDRNPFACQSETPFASLNGLSNERR